MEDSSFELLTKMYSEMTEQFKALNKKLDSKADISDIVRFENELSPKVDALLDGYKQLAEGQEKIKGQLQDLKSAVDDQEVNVKVLNKMVK